MTAPTPMSDERLAELEQLAESTRHHAGGLGFGFVRELVAEVHRLRRGGKTLGEIVDKQLTEIVDLTESHDIIGEDGDGDWMLVWERLHQIRADRDASNARVASLEEQVKLLAGANRQLGNKAERRERENDRLAASREHPHSAKLAARVLRAEDRVANLDRQRAIAWKAAADANEHEQAMADERDEANSDRDRARSIAVALEAELAQLQATARTVLDDRDRLQDQMLRVREQHPVQILQVSPPPPERQIVPVAVPCRRCGYGGA